MPPAGGRSTVLIIGEDNRESPNELYVGDSRLEYEGAASSGELGWVNPCGVLGEALEAAGRRGPPGRGRGDPNVDLAGDRSESMRGG
jgi:hypothetical protein